MERGDLVKLVGRTEPYAIYQPDASLTKCHDVRKDPFCNFYILGTDKTIPVSLDDDVAGSLSEKIYNPSNAEYLLVKEAFKSQIDAILNGADEYPEIPERTFSYSSGPIPENFKQLVEGDPIIMSIIFKNRFIDTSASSDDKANQKEMNRFAYKNLAFLAKAAGYDGLFNVEELTFKAEDPFKINILGWENDSILMRDASGSYRGMAYKFKED